MAVVTELITRFGFQGNLGRLDEFNAGLGRAIAGLGAVAAAAGAAGGALFAFVSSTTQTLDPMVQLSRETGVAVDRVQALGFAASQTGSTSQALQSSLRGLSQRLGEAANGTGEGVDVFERLNISLRDSEGNVRGVDAVLTDLRHNMGGLSSAERISVANKLGIDPSLVQLLGQTDEQMGALTARARELGVVTTEQADAAAAFNDSLTVLRFGMDAIRNSIAIGFAPQMQELVERFTDFLVANRELFENGISVVADGIIALLDAFERLAPLLGAATVAFVTLKLATGGFAAIMATIASPVFVAIAAMTAALLVIDDLIVAFEGGDSVIRRFFESFFGIDIAPILQDIVDSFNEMVDDIIKSFIPLQRALSSLFSAVVAFALGDFDGMVEGIKGAFKGFFDYLIQSWLAVIGLFGNLADIAFPGMVDDIKDYFRGLFDWVDDKIQGVVDAIKAIGDFLGVGASDIDGPARNTSGIGIRPGPASGGSQTNNNVNQDIKIDVNSNNPEEAGVQVRSQLEEQMRDLGIQFNRGGR